MITKEQAIQLMKDKGYNAYIIHDSSQRHVTELKDATKDVDAAVASLNSDFQLLQGYGSLIVKMSPYDSVKQNWGAARTVMVKLNEDQQAGTLGVSPAQAVAPQGYYTAAAMEDKIALMKMQIELDQLKDGGGKTEFDKIVPERFHKWVDLAICKGLKVPNELQAAILTDGLGTKLSGPPEPGAEGEAETTGQTVVEGVAYTNDGVVDSVSPAETHQAVPTGLPVWSVEQVAELQQILGEIQAKVQYDKYKELMKAIQKNPALVDTALQFLSK